LGSHAVFLCRNLEAELAWVDFDRVESKNLSAQAYVKQSLGKNKAEALRLQLLNFYGTSATAFPVRLTVENVEAVCQGATLLVDCFDNLASRQLLMNHARSKGTPLVHAGVAADGRFAPDAEDSAGQATCEGGEHLPTLALVAASLARIIQDFLRDQTRRDAWVSLSGVQVSEG
jgi:hypothetical protein